VRWEAKRIRCALRGLSARRWCGDGVEKDDGGVRPARSAAVDGCRSPQPLIWGDAACESGGPRGIPRRKGLVLRDTACDGRWSRGTRATGAAGLEGQGRREPLVSRGTARQSVCSGGVLRPNGAWCGGILRAKVGDVEGYCPPSPLPRSHPITDTPESRFLPQDRRGECEGGWPQWHGGALWQSAGGREEGRKGGREDEWKSGRVEEWKSGRVDQCISAILERAGASCNDTCAQ
jgi:hypothetical protein